MLRHACCTLPGCHTNTKHDVVIIVPVMTAMNVATATMATLLSRDASDADLEGENVFGDLLAFQNLLGLQFKLIHGCLPGSAGSLIGADHHALYLHHFINLCILLYFIFTFLCLVGADHHALYLHHFHHGTAIIHD